MSKSGSRTAIEQSPALTLSALASLFQVPVSLLCFNEATAKATKAADEFCTVLLRAFNGGWIGERRPEAW